MNKIISIILLPVLLISSSLCLFCSSLKVNAQAETTKAKIAHEQKVHHLFTHALIAHPKIAFNDGNKMSKNYDIDCLTPLEFSKILQELYIKGYMLISSKDISREDHNGIYKTRVLLPSGKKPLLLSFDDINYYIKKMNMGMADKLIIHNGAIATYTEHASPQISHDNDCVPILDAFVRTHPDFSYKGAKGMINLTGFDGVLGYRTQSKSNDRKEEIKKAKEVVHYLKNNGWEFACHSYGHYHMNKISTEKFCRDTDKWLQEVQPIVGKTNCYVYPYGEYETEANGKISEKHQKLLASGFRFFMSVGGKCYFKEMSGKASYLFMDRLPMDGNTMRKSSHLFHDYFNVASVYDHVRPSKLV